MITESKIIGIGEDDEREIQYDKYNSANKKGRSIKHKQIWR